jgi:hypothetical protein
MIPKVRVVHRTTGRLRVRVAERRKDADWLKTAAAQVAELPGVQSVEVGTQTGSLLLLHVPDQDPEPALRALGLWCFDDAPPPEEPPLQSLKEIASSLERELRGLTPGAPDLRTMLFLSLGALAMAQVARGQVMAPAVSLFWYALDLLMQSTRAGSVSDRGTGRRSEPT